MFNYKVVESDIKVINEKRFGEIKMKIRTEIKKVIHLWTERKNEKYIFKKSIRNKNFISDWLTFYKI